MEKDIEKAKADLHKAMELNFAHHVTSVWSSTLGCDLSLSSSLSVEAMEKAIEKAKADGESYRESKSEKETKKQVKALNMMFDFLASIDIAKNGEL